MSNMDLFIWYWPGPNLQCVANKYESVTVAVKEKIAAAKDVFLSK